MTAANDSLGKLCRHHRLAHLLAISMSYDRKYFGKGLSKSMFHEVFDKFPFNKLEDIDPNERAQDHGGRLKKKWEDNESGRHYQVREELNGDTFLLGRDPHSKQIEIWFFPYKAVQQFYEETLTEIKREIEKGKALTASEGSEETQ